MHCHSVKSVQSLITVKSVQSLIALSLNAPLLTFQGPAWYEQALFGLVLLWPVLYRLCRPVMTDQDLEDADWLSDLASRDRLLQPEQHLEILQGKCHECDPEFVYEDDQDEDNLQYEGCVCGPCDCARPRSFLRSRAREDVNKQLCKRPRDRVAIVSTPAADAQLLGEISTFTHHRLWTLWRVYEQVHDGLSVACHELYSVSAGESDTDADADESFEPRWQTYSLTPGTRDSGEHIWCEADNRR